MTTPFAHRALVLEKKPVPKRSKILIITFSDMDAFQNPIHVLFVVIDINTLNRTTYSHDVYYKNKMPPPYSILMMRNK